MEDIMRNASRMKSSNNPVDWSCLNVIPAKRIEEWTKDDVVGLKFDSDERARIFYTRCGMAIGFGICVQDRKFANAACVFRKWVCCREGYRRKKYLERKDRKRKPKALTRVGCPTLFRIKLDQKTGKYVVMDFELEHNHFLPSEQMQFLPSYRSVKGSKKAQIESLQRTEIMNCMLIKLEDMSMLLSLRRISTTL